MLGMQHIAPERIRPLLRVEYEQLVELGLFDNERVELLHGTLVTMSPQGVKHAGVIELITWLLAKRLPDHARLRPQCPLAVADNSEPEPDLAVVAASDDIFKSHPTTALLVIEVADSSLQTDRDVKMPLYAENGIPEYWIVNLRENVVEVHSKIHDNRYTQTVTYDHSGEITLIEFPNIQITVSDFLPNQ